jgi:predicted neuraminidase
VAGRGLQSEKIHNASDRSQVPSYAMLQNEDDGVNFSSGARILALIIRNFTGEGFGKSGYVWSNF